MDVFTGNAPVIGEQEFRALAARALFTRKEELRTSLDSRCGARAWHNPKHLSPPHRYPSCCREEHRSTPCVIRGPLLKPPTGDAPY